MNEYFVSINNQPVAIDTFADCSITVEQLETIRADTKGFKLLYPKLNNEALIHMVNLNLNNCSISREITYDGVLKSTLVPLLCKRLRSSIKQTFKVRFIVVVNFDNKDTSSLFYCNKELDIIPQIGWQLSLNFDDLGVIFIEIYRITVYIDNDEITNMVHQTQICLKQVDNDDRPLYICNVNKI